MCQANYFHLIMSDSEDEREEVQSSVTFNKSARNNLWFRRKRQPTFALTFLPQELDTSDTTIQSLRVQNEVLAICGRNNKLIIRDMDSGDAPYTNQITHPVHGLFLSPNGQHCFVSCTSGELYYICPKLRIKEKISMSSSTSITMGASASASAVVVESVGWDQNAVDLDPGTVLIGSRRGGIVYAVTVKISPERASASATVTTGLFEYPDAAPITSIDVEIIEGCTIVMMSTRHQLFRLIGKHVRGSSTLSNLKTVFEAYRHDPHKACKEFIQVADSNARGNLTVFRPVATAAPHGYIWGSDASIVHGVFNTADKTMSRTSLVDGLDPNSDQMEITQKIMTRERIDFGRGRPPGFDKAPIDVSLSAFHMYLLYDDRLVVLNVPVGLPWKSIVSEDVPYGASGAAISPSDQLSKLKEADFNNRLCFDSSVSSRRVKGWKALERDVFRRKIYAYSDTSVWELDVKRERQGQWRLFLEMALWGDGSRSDSSAEQRHRYFNAAAKLTQNLPSKYDTVTFEWGKFLIENGCYRQATQTFAKSRRFYEVYLYLSHHLRKQQAGSKTTVNIDNLVINFLELRLREIGNTAKESEKPLVQLACLFTLLLNKKLERATQANSSSESNDIKRREYTEAVEKCLGYYQKKVTVRSSDKASNKRASSTKTEEPSFLGNVVSDDESYYRLLERMLESQGQKEILMRFAENTGRYRQTLSYYCRQAKNFQRACEILIQNCVNEKNSKLWYEFAPEIMQQRPCQLFNGLLKSVVTTHSNDEGGHHYRSVLQPERLLPALINYQQQKHEDPEADQEEHLVISYLTFLVRKKNLKSRVMWNYLIGLMLQHDVQNLYDILESPEANYTMEWALRKCLAHNSSDSLDLCLVLYRKMRLIPEAIGTSLARPGIEGITQAKELIKDAKSLDAPLQKKLWRDIAEAQYRMQQSTRSVLDIVKESGGALRLEDVLQTLTGDSTVLQEIKDGICEQLDDYASTIKDLQHKMMDATQTAKRIKEEEKTLSHQFGYITATQNCDICARPLLRNSMAAPFFVFPTCRHAVREDCVTRLYAQCTPERLKRIAQELMLPPSQHQDVDAIKNADCPVCGEFAIAEVGESYYDTNPTASSSKIWDVTNTELGLRHGMQVAGAKSSSNGPKPLEAKLRLPGRLNKIFK